MARRSASTAKKRTVSSTATGAVTFRSRRMPATVTSGASSSFQTRTSAGTRRLSRTEGSSKWGVTMAMSPSRGITAAVRRSLRHHCTPVKYTSEAPGSISNAPMPSLPMSARAFPMRARNSAGAMGTTSAVMDLRAAAASAAKSRLGASVASADAPAMDKTSRLLILIRRYSPESPPGTNQGL